MLSMKFQTFNSIYIRWIKKIKVREERGQQKRVGAD